MIRLTNTTTDLISLITGQNGAKVVVSYSDATASGYTGANQVTSITSATTTTICGTPAASTVRDVDYINIKNTFAGSHAMTIQVSVSATLYVLLDITLLASESVCYTHGSGWTAIDANGNRKEVTSSIFSTLTVTGAATVGGALTVTGNLAGSTSSFSGAITSTVPSGAFLQTVSATTGATWFHMLNTSSDAYIGIEGSAGGAIITGTTAYALVYGQFQNKPVQIAANNAVVATFQTGTQFGSPTGGDKGAGTANFAADIYKNNTAYTNPDYVLEHWATGKIVRFAGKEGAAGYAGLQPLAEVEEFARNNFHLPRFGQKARYGLFGGSDALLASVEESYLYLFDLSRRVALLEAA